MNRKNKKEAVAALHKEQIMKAAENLFAKKGYAQTTIEDISKVSEYSRRTIYSYFDSKDDILHHIAEKGLIALKQEIEQAIYLNNDFFSKYKAICNAMIKYHTEYPYSVNNLNRSNMEDFNFDILSDTIKHIFILGTEINTILSEFIESGKTSGIVRKDIVPMLTVYILWSSISALITLVQTKGQYISNQLSTTNNDLLDYGFKQIINSILEVKI